MSIYAVLTILSLFVTALKEVSACHGFCMTPDDWCHDQYGNRNSYNNLGRGLSQSNSSSAQSNRNKDHEEIPVALQKCSQTRFFDPVEVFATEQAQLRWVALTKRLLLTSALSRIEEACSTIRNNIERLWCNQIKVCAWKIYGGVIYDRVSGTYYVENEALHNVINSTNDDDDDDDDDEDADDA